MTTCFLLLAVALLPQDRKLATIPEGAEAGPFVFAGDGSRVVYSIREGESFRLVEGDWKSGRSLLPILAALPRTGGETYYSLHAGHELRFFDKDRALFALGMDSTVSRQLPGWPAGKTIVTTVRDTRREVTAVVVDDKPGKFHKGVLSIPVVSADGKVVALALETGEGHFIVVNEVLGPLCDDVTLPALSADGKVVAYGCEENEKFFLVRGERKDPLPECALGVVLSGDGGSSAYWRRVPGPVGMKRIQMKFGEQLGPEVGLIEGACISPDGKHIAYRAATSEGAPRLVIDRRLLEVGDLHSMPVFLEGGRVGFGVRQGRELWWKTVEVGN